MSTSDRRRTAATKEKSAMPAVSDQEQQVQWKMPPVSLGQWVKFWRSGERKAGKPEVGAVTALSVTGRTIRLMLGDGTTKTSVRHVDDPRLSVNPFMRADGAWEHTDETIQFNKLVSAVEELSARVAALEQSRTQKSA